MKLQWIGKVHLVLFRVNSTKILQTVFTGMDVYPVSSMRLYKPQPLTSYESQVTGYRLQVTGYSITSQNNPQTRK